MQTEITPAAPPQTHSARGDFVVRRGTFFQVGDYPDKQFALTAAEADVAIAEFTPVPLNIEHIPTIFDGKLGMVQRLWREGKNILAEYAIPRWLHDVTQGEAIKISSEWSRSAKRPQGGALVLNPRVTDAVMQAAFKRFDTPGNTSPKKSSDERLNARPDTRKESEPMSLLTGLKALFQRAGVPISEIDAHLSDPAPAVMDAHPAEPALTEDENARFAMLEAELVRLRTEAQSARQEQETVQQAARFAADTQTIEGWVRGLKMTPAEADAWREIARDKPAAFAAITPVVDARPPLPHFAGATVRASETADADRLESLTRQRMKEKGLDHTAAFNEVCGENRELALSVRMKSQEGN